MSSVIVYYYCWEALEGSLSHNSIETNQQKDNFYNSNKIKN